MKLLVDADIVSYRSAAAAEKEEVGIAKYYADRLIDDIVAATKASSFEMFLTGETNFRYQIYFEYKANRLNVPRPRHLKEVQQYLVDRYKAKFSVGNEADDEMGIAQCSSELGTTCIVSIDKDLLMIPGKHFQWEIRGNSGGKPWVKEARHIEVTPLEGARWFYSQCLQGDPADNIKGCPGVGKVGAAAMLADCTTEEEMFNTVREAYDHDEAFLMNAQVLWIWRKENDLWEFPIGKEEEA